MSNVYSIDTNGNYRAPPPAAVAGSAVVVTMDDPDDPKFDPATGTTQIPLDDGTLTIAFGPPKGKKKDSDFEENLAELIDEVQLSTVAERLLKGIELDDQSRSAWLQNMSDGISLLGLEIKNPRGAAASGATPAEGVSTVDHPIMLEAVLRFQANARGELLPSDGPVKVRNDGTGNSTASVLAQALEKDLNHYLTKVAKEYYPDTDRMLLMLGFSGISFKKGYHDPIKQRPVIASIDAKDLIVSNAATDIDGAGRVTHRIMMRQSVLKRMQLVGAYRDVSLGIPSLTQNKNIVDTKIDLVQGIAPATSAEPDDVDRELYECYCEIDLPGFEHDLEGEPTGLPLPYKVVLDREARKVLEIRRNWHEDDVFCMPRNRIIAYTFIPGLGFYGIGLLNVLGNATKAMTAAWRLMIDAGMFANFPGFLSIKSLGKQLTNQFRIPPGGGMPIDTVGQDIRASVMALPYKDPSAVFIQLIESIGTTAQRVGGTAELQIGEGKQDAPVGTTLALIEQATKLMSAVHKRLHQAQGQEFDMLKSLLMEDPAALWRHNKKSKVLALLVAQSGKQPLVDAQQQAEERHREMFVAALSDCELVPSADPNTSSQTERYLKTVALRQMAVTNQNIDLNKVDARAFRIMGIDDGDSLFKPPQPNQPPPPEQILAMASAKTADARMLDSQTKANEAKTKAAGLQLSTHTDLAGLQSKEKIASLGVARELVIHNRDQDLAREQIASGERQSAADRTADLHRQLIGHVADAHSQAADQAHGIHGQLVGHAIDSSAATADRGHKMALAAGAQQHAGKQAAMDRTHDLLQAAMEPQPAGTGAPNVVGSGNGVANPDDPTQ